MDLSDEETKALREFIEDMSEPESFEDAWKTMRKLYNRESPFYKNLTAALGKLGLKRRRNGH